LADILKAARIKPEVNRGGKILAPQNEAARKIFPPGSTRLAFAFSGGLWFIARPKTYFMSTKVETKTRELCEAILEHLQTGGLKQRIDTFLADTSARSQYEGLMSKGQALQEKQQNGQVLEPAEISAFESDRDALLKNPVATAFLDAQEEMHDLKHRVQKHVNKTIELSRVPTAEDLESSCGNHGGCGCHDH
jgi:cell fate (sporulation/competence/biofilm development) regulator YlbF (YheA/YmcA/DUF963 family)